jgi:predicted small secreted protein
MIIFETLKFIAEVITSIATAIIVITHLIKFMFKQYNRVKIFFKTTFPMFFKGVTNLEGKKVRFFKGLKQQRERNKNILKAISPDFQEEDILVLDKKALIDIISNSKAFYTIQQRKK